MTVVGAMTEPTGATQPQRATGGTSGYAIAGFVLSLIAWPIGSILAVIFGRKAKRDIEASGGTLGGGGLATAATVIGWIGIVVGVLVILIVIVGAASA